MWLFDISDIKSGNWKRQIARNGKLNIYFKNNFKLLVINVTQLNFLYWQNVHIWHFTEVNHKRSLLFVVLPTLISWGKTKIFVDYNNKISNKNVYISFIRFPSVKRFNSLVFIKDWLKSSSFDIWMHRCQLFCHNQGIYLDEYIQVTKH